MGTHFLYIQTQRDSSETKMVAYIYKVYRCIFSVNHTNVIFIALEICKNGFVSIFCERKGSDCIYDPLQEFHPNCMSVPCTNEAHCSLECQYKRNETWVPSLYCQNWISWAAELSRVFIRCLDKSCPSLKFPARQHLSWSDEFGASSVLLSKVIGMCKINLGQQLNQSAIGAHWVWF